MDLDRFMASKTTRKLKFIIIVGAVSENQIKPKYTRIARFKVYLMIDIMPRHKKIGGSRIHDPWLCSQNR